MAGDIKGENSILHHIRAGCTNRKQTMRSEGRSLTQDVI
jgi:hypothetical protein